MDPDAARVARHRYWRLAAMVVFVASLAVPFHQVWREDARSVVPFPSGRDYETANLERALEMGLRVDTLFHVYVVGRNASTILHEPSAIYDAPHCYPAERALLLGEPMITLALQAAPTLLVTGDPIFAYNVMLVLNVLLSAIGMYLLIEEWTDHPGAGIVAGILYAFHPLKLGGVAHPFVNDSVWIVFALYFGRRLFARGRLRDAIGLGVAVSLQVGGSLYPFMAGVLIAIPMLGWLIAHYGVRSLRWEEPAVALSLVGVAVGIVFVPYLWQLGGPEAAAVPGGFHALSPWSDLLPGGARFAGWLVLGLGAAACFAPRDRVLRGISGDPRWALGIALLLIGLVAVSTPGIPDVYRLLSEFVPGLSTVRRPEEILSGAHLVLAVFAGLGTAGLFRLVPTAWGPAATGLMVGLALLVTLRADWIGQGASATYGTLAVRPSDEEVELFRQLDEIGNRGPLLEVPARGAERSAKSLVRSLFHGRRTSACYGSLVASEAERVKDLALRLAQERSLVEIANLGFTTVLFDRDALQNLRPRFEKRVVESRGPVRLRPLASTDRLAAYEITEAPVAGESPWRRPRAQAGPNP